MRSRNTYVIDEVRRLMGQGQRIWIELRLGSGSTMRRILSDNIITHDDGLTLTSLFNEDDNLVFGRTIMNQITIGVFNTEEFRNFMVYWKDLGIRFLVENNETGDPQQLYISENYYIERPMNMNHTKVLRLTGYDNMKKFDVPAERFIKSLRYPLTFEQILEKLCDFVGVVFWSAAQSTTAEALRKILNREFTESPFGADYYSSSCREILSLMATACGCYAVAHSGLKMRWFMDAPEDYTVTEDELFSYETNDYYEQKEWSEFNGTPWDDVYTNDIFWGELVGSKAIYGYSGIKIVNDDQEIIYPPHTVTNLYTIRDNPFLKVNSQQDIEDYIIPIYERLNQLQFCPPFEVECFGYGLVEGGDIIKIQFGNETRVCPVYTSTLKWNGGFITESYSTSGTIDKEV